MLSRIKAVHLRSAIMAMACAFQLNTATSHDHGLIDTIPKHRSQHPVQPLAGHASHSSRLFACLLQRNQPPPIKLCRVAAFLSVAGSWQTMRLEEIVQDENTFWWCD